MLILRKWSTQCHLLFEDELKYNEIIFIQADVFVSKWTYSQTRSCGHLY